MEIKTACYKLKIDEVNSWRFNTGTIFSVSARNSERKNLLSCKMKHGWNDVQKNQRLLGQQKITTSKKFKSLQRSGSCILCAQRRSDVWGPDLEMVKKCLLQDLPNQYVMDMDWSVYSPSLIFVDPVTRLQGRLLYRGMITTLRLLVHSVFDSNTAVFELHSIEEVHPHTKASGRIQPKELGMDISPVCALRTTWTTKAISKWGSELFISGDDIFRIEKNGLIISHESAWNENPGTVFGNLKLRK